MDVPNLVVDEEPANLLAMEAVLVQRGIEFAKNRTTHLLPTLAPRSLRTCPLTSTTQRLPKLSSGWPGAPVLRFLQSLGRD